MTTYSFIDESGETRLRGTIDPAPGGGAQSVQSVRVTIAFDTPNLLTGVLLHSALAGEALVPTADQGGRAVGMVSIPTEWDGTTPTLHIGTPALVGFGDFMNIALDTNGDSDYGGGYTAVAAPNLFSFPPGYFPADTDMIAWVDDGNGGDPESDVGTAEIIFLVLAAEAAG